MRIVVRVMKALHAWLRSGAALRCAALCPGVIIGITLLSVVIARGAEAPTAPAPAPAPTSTSDLKVGEFTTTFTERSPLSSTKEIARRLPQKDPVAAVEAKKLLQTLP